MSIDLGRDQKIAVDRIDEWYESSYNPGIFYLGGYAGTGKTTVAKYLADKFRNKGIGVVVMAPTGKAAEVLTKKGLPAKTVHSCLYRPKGGTFSKIKELRKVIASDAGYDERSDARLELDRLISISENPQFEFKDMAGEDEDDVGLVIVDEFSMVPDSMVKDILALEIPVLAFGDPGQLPPVAAKQSRKPNYVMEQIHRQAEKNPIIKLSMMARLEGGIPYGDWGDARKIPKSEYQRELLFQHDQIICGRNVTRHKLNRVMRKELGRTDVFPVKDDKLICLRNDYKLKLINGMHLTATSNYDELSGSISVESEDKQYDDLQVYTGAFCDAYGVNYEKLSFEERMDLELADLDYGYAITCHKSQGSEWDSVLVIEEPIGRTDEERSRWLYTAVTRAKEKLTIMTRN